MKINKVSSSGIHRLIDAYKESMNNPNSIMFKGKSDSYFENMEISLFLSDIKGAELIALKKFCPSLIVLNDKSYTAFTATPKKITNSVLRVVGNKTHDDEVREEELSTLGNKLVSLHNYVKKGLVGIDGVHESDIFPMYDIGSYRFKAIARFEGVNILSLLDAFPEYKLYKQTKKEFIEEGTKEFENLCAKQFVTNFFSKMEDIYASVDILTDVMFNKEFLDSLNYYNSCMCTHIRNPYEEIRMMNYNNPNELINVLRSIRVDSLDDGYYINTSSDFIYHFAAETSIEVFLYFLAYTDLVYYYTDLKTIAGVESNVYAPDCLNEEQRVVYLDSIKALDDWRLKALKALTEEEKSSKQVHYSRLELYNFIPRGSRIKFMIKGTYEELNKGISNISALPDMNQSSYFANTTSVSELLRIMQTIDSSYSLIDTIWNSLT